MLGVLMHAYASEMANLTASLMMSRNTTRKEIHAMKIVQAEKLLMTLGDLEARHDSESTLLMKEQALSASSILLHSRSACRARAHEIYEYLGIAHFRMGQWDQAIEMHRHYLAIAHNLNDHTSEAKAYGNLRSAYLQKGEIAKGIAEFHKCLKLSQAKGDKIAEAGLLLVKQVNSNSCWQVNLAHYCTSIEELPAKCDQTCFRQVSNYYQNLNSVFFNQTYCFPLFLACSDYDVLVLILFLPCTPIRVEPICFVRVFKITIS